MSMTSQSLHGFSLHFKEKLKFLVVFSVLKVLLISDISPLAWANIIAKQLYCLGTNVKTWNNYLFC